MDKRIETAIDHLAQTAPDLHASIAGCDMAEIGGDRAMAVDGKTGVVSYGRGFLETLDQTGVDYMVAFTAQMIATGAHRDMARDDIDTQTFGFAGNVVVHHMLAARGMACTVKGAVVDDETGRLGVWGAYHALMEGRDAEDGTFGPRLATILDRASADARPLVDA